MSTYSFSDLVDKTTTITAADRILVDGASAASLTYSYSWSTLTLTSSLGSATVSRLLEAELSDVLVFLDGSKLMYGTGGADTLSHGAGADEKFGGGGADVLQGNSGNDTIDAGTGADAVYGGADSITGSSAADTLYGGQGGDTIDGQGGANRLYGADGADSIVGGADADTLYGGDDADTVDGAGGADSISGDDGADSIGGGAGTDSIYGGSRADTINGGAGRDTLYGHDGADVFQFAGGYVVGSSTNGGSIDVVMDWSADDRIDFLSSAAATASNYREVGGTFTYAEAVSQADTLLADVSIVYVAVQVGLDVVVFCDDGTGEVTDAIALAGRTLGAIDHTGII